MVAPKGDMSIPKGLGLSDNSYHDWKQFKEGEAPRMARKIYSETGIPTTSEWICKDLPGEKLNWQIDISLKLARKLWLTHRSSHMPEIILMWQFAVETLVVDCASCAQKVVPWGHNLAQKNWGDWGVTACIFCCRSDSLSMRVLLFMLCPQRTLRANILSSETWEGNA